MIQSMTGYGTAQYAENGVSYALEIRTVNNRYLKLAIRLPDHIQFVEPVVEKLLRQRVVRGTVTYTLRVRSDAEAGGRSINLPVLQHYVDQMAHVHLPGQIAATIDLGALAALPGVCDLPELDERAQSLHLDIIGKLTSQALDALTSMRGDEGRALCDDLFRCCDAIRTQLEQVQARAPFVVDEYHARLKSRVSALMQAGGFDLAADGLMREVALFAERCDIGEELARLTSHLDQFVELCRRDEQIGRTLDFLTQELLREANTIASKSNDAAIARSIVEVKGMIDRLREQSQNVE